MGEPGGNVLLELRMRGYGEVLSIPRVVVLDDFDEPVFLELHAAAIVDVRIE